MRNGKTARSCVIVTGLGWFLLYAAIFLMALHCVGTNARLYYALQLRADVPTVAAIESSELLSVDETLARYLSGDPNALEDSPFNADEIEHMRDCYELFRLLRKIMFVALIAGIVLIGLGMFAMKYRGIIACVAAAVCLFIPLLCVTLWAALDFDGLFRLFHQLLFTNELWLMDPAKDLMIRICQESMFESMAAIVAAVGLCFMGFVIAIHKIVFGKDRRRDYARL